jgi:hypothetical protein
MHVLVQLVLSACVAVAAELSQFRQWCDGLHSFTTAKNKLLLLLLLHVCSCCCTTLQDL